LTINERVHVDLAGEDLGGEPPILDAAGAQFFTGPDREMFVSPMSLDRQDAFVWGSVRAVPGQSTGVAMGVGGAPVPGW
jgi:hypothetical protein